MIDVIADILSTCRKVIPESFYLINDRPSVSYPYAVFYYDGDAREWNQDGFYIDVDIFDNLGQNQERIEELTSDLKKYLEHRVAWIDSGLIRYQYNGANTIDTGSDTLQRRNMRFYITVDWSRDYD
ncbi:TPA: hypothetical protein U2E07_000962 [Streptococcus suis]|uniref:hypothetical protein n=1 Tax=Streptococcus suis TaxID=1307 RepID=UPI0015830823|nr:hypothetical protein [Streptococcus suis]MCG9862662.1 hypothetical protein [Streptococcus suis]MCG9883903.1 hypothetical protein [Streptococcus suis]HEM6498928.1 hypothetical protein [Streptococcus suis]